MSRSKNILSTIEDVANYLGANRADNESISRCVYKGTSCGAWAEVIEETAFEIKKETWSVRYAKVENIWQAISAERDNTPVEFSAVPDNVREYFMLNGKYDLEYNLQELANGSSDFTCTENLDAKYPNGVRLIFAVGSIVEGIDAEVQPEYVSLPAKGSEIDDAIARVEAAAKDLWHETHGCEGCASRLSIDFDFNVGHIPVVIDCSECNGYGISI